MKFEFILKPDGQDRLKLFQKARWCVWWDFQDEYIDYNPYETYDPVTSHEIIRIMISIYAADGLIVEVGNLVNLYLYGDIDCDMIIENPSI